MFFSSDDRPVANQTELIYSVFVNGKPILAVTAANDMKLVDDNEVSFIMEKDIYMKAERKYSNVQYDITYTARQVQTCPYQHM